MFYYVTFFSYAAVMDANHLRTYFTFSKKERGGIIALLVILAVVWFIPVLLVPEERFDEEGYAAFRHSIEQLQQQTAQRKQSKDPDTASSSFPAPSSYGANTNTAVFYFDPNTLSPEGWQRLGISGRTAGTIQNFTAKGGRFHKPEDISKIYGLKKEDYKRLLPYVRIVAKESNNPPFRHNRNTNDHTYNKAPVTIAINTADTTALKTLPGIGSRLANRIVSFREKLGGFYSVEQVAEVYGISDSVFQQIKPRLQCDPGAIQKININTAGIDELKAHPYIKYQVANAVIQYRLQHGNFQNRYDLKQVHLVSDHLLQKLEHYINY